MLVPGTRMLTNRAAESKSKLMPRQMKKYGCWVAKRFAEEKKQERKPALFAGGFFLAEAVPRHHRQAQSQQH